jgi:hypothetical protein
MQVQDRYFDAAIAVLDWDLPEVSYSNAVNAQATHLAGSEAEDDWRDSCFDITVH